jgi:hypothetical protein
MGKAASLQSERATKQSERAANNFRTPGAAYDKEWRAAPRSRRMGRAERHHLCGPIEADQLAEMIAKVTPMPSEIVELVRGRVVAPAATECQQRLSQIRAAALDQRDIGQFALSKPIAERWVTRSRPAPPLPTAAIWWVGRSLSGAT